MTGETLFDPKHSESFIKIWGYPYELLGTKGRINTAKGKLGKQDK